MNKHAKAWVAALRSGKYQQGRMRLKHGNTFCGLGVGCELAVAAGVIPPPCNDIYDDVYIFTLPRKVTDWLGLCSSMGHYSYSSLTRDNDDGKTFLEIADIIESEPAGLFVNGGDDA